MSYHLSFPFQLYLKFIIRTTQKKLGNDMSTTFLQQILSVRLLLIVIVGAKK